MRQRARSFTFSTPAAVAIPPVSEMVILIFAHFPAFSFSGFGVLIDGAAGVEVGVVPAGGGPLLSGS